MRVLEVIQGLDDGGAEIALLRRLRHQPDEIHTTILTSKPVRPGISERLRSANTDLVVHGLSWGGSSWMHGLVAAIDPQVIVSHSPGETAKLLAWSGRIEAPIVVVAHHSLVSDDLTLRRAKEAMLRRLNPRADLHIAVSQPAAMGAQCAGGRRVEVHLLGAELGDAPPNEAPWPAGTRIRLMTLSRLVWFKNLETLVEAVGAIAARMRQDGAHLAIVGSGPRRSAILRHIAAGGLDDLVSIHDFAPDPSGVLRAADLLVNCSTSEGGPLTLYEASLAGTRLLSTRTGASEAVLGGDTMSVLVEGASRDALAAGLLRALDLGPVTPLERSARAERSLRWDSATTSEQFYDLLRSVALS